MLADLASVDEDAVTKPISALCLLVVAAVTPQLVLVRAPARPGRHTLNLGLRHQHIMVYNTYYVIQLYIIQHIMLKDLTKFDFS